jgi:hypothetical protein
MGLLKGSSLAQPLLFGMGRLSGNLIFLGMIALGAFCTEGIHFGFLFNALNGFPGHLTFDCRDLEFFSFQKASLIAFSTL